MFRLTHLALALLFVAASFQSCTCQRDLPEPPTQTVRRQTGWSQSAPPKPVEPVAPAPEEVKVPPPPAEQEAPELGEPGAPPEEVAIPEDFPTDVPLFEGAEPFAVQPLAGNAKNVHFRVEATPPEIFSFYEEKMRGEGWDMSQQYQAKEQSFLSFKKGNWITNMTITRDPTTGKQIISIMYQEEEPLPFPEF
jgi:hypothetical protein